MSQGNIGTTLTLKDITNASISNNIFPATWPRRVTNNNFTLLLIVLLDEMIKPLFLLVKKVN
jgi:hypothetical protein